MVELHVHAQDTSGSGAAYRVFVMSDGTAVAGALRAGWERTAQGVQDGLKRRAAAAGWPRLNPETPSRRRQVGAAVMEQPLVQRGLF